MNSIPPAAPTPAYPPPSAPPPGSGPASMAGTKRNWKPCYIAACAVILVVVLGAIALAVWLGKSFGSGFLGGALALGNKMSTLQTEVNATPEQEVLAAAQSVTDAELAANAAAYEGQWIAVDGVLSGEPYHSQGEYSFGGSAGSLDGMQYSLGGSVQALDVSGAPATTHAGDTVRVYGKIVVWDMNSIKQLPFVGKAIEEEMQNDPALQGNLIMVFIVAKKVELLESASIIPSPEAAAENAAPAGEVTSEETIPPAL